MKDNSYCSRLLVLSSESMLCLLALLVTGEPTARAQEITHERAVLKAHAKGGFPHVAFAPDGKTLASSGGRDKNVIVWDATTLKPLKTLEHPAPISGLAFCPKTGLLTTSMASVVYFWDATTGEHLRTLQKAGAILAYAPDGTLLATDAGVTNSMVVLWDAKTGKELGELKEHTDQILGLGFTPDGKVLASSSWDGSVIFWDVKTRQKVAKWQPFTEQAFCPTFSPDGKLLAVGGDTLNQPQPKLGAPRNTTVKLWDVAAGKEKDGLWTISKPIRTLAFSPDGKLLLVGGANYDMEILDVAKRNWWAYLWGRRAAGSFQSMALSLDGKMAVTAHQDGTLSVWDVPKDKQKIDWEALGERNTKKQK